MLIANKYRILDKLGAGQFGEIFKCKSGWVIRSK